MHKTIKPGSREFRAITVSREAVDEEARTVELAFSSELPYERWWGVEILDHSKSAIRLDRLKAGGPLLMDHDSRDHVGVIESVKIGSDRVGRAVVRFGRSARAEEVFRDVVDGIRRNVSVGYMIHKAVLEETSDDGDQQDKYRVIDWEPFEVSLVAVPADPTVGIGRELDARAHVEFIEPEPESKTEQEYIAMPDPIQNSPVDERAIEQRGAEAAQKRVTDMLAIGDQFKHYDGPAIAAQMIREGKGPEELKQALLDKFRSTPLPTSDIGMTEREAKRFSLVRALAALANPKERKFQEAAAFEMECSRAVADKIGRAAQGIFVPMDVQRRDLTVGTTTAGGHTVATDLLSGSFIEVLRNRLALIRAGATFMDGLVGNIAIPRQTGAATAYWVSESGAPTESQQAFDQVTMSPKTVGAFTDISRKLLLQSSISVEQFVQNDLSRVLGLEIDRVGINGSGTSPEPRGVLNTSGIGSVAGGTNGAAPTWANIVELWSDVATANADFGTTGFLTNSKVVGKLMTTEKASGTAQFVCPGFPDANGLTAFGGARAVVSNQVPSNLDKGTSTGVCSAITFGNWADLIVAMWGALDLTVDPYTGSTSGTVRVVALQDVDVAVRHAESFSAMLDALTS